MCEKEKKPIKSILESTLHTRWRQSNEIKNNSYICINKIL